MDVAQNDKVRVVQTLLFMGGINTLLQTLFGTRLPTVIGGSYAFLVPIMSIIRDASLVQIADDHEVRGEEHRRSRGFSRRSALALKQFGDSFFFSLMQRFLQSMRAVQGSLIVASGVQIIIGYSQLWAIFSRHELSGSSLFFFLEFSAMGVSLVL